MDLTSLENHKFSGQYEESSLKPHRLKFSPFKSILKEDLITFIVQRNGGRLVKQGGMVVTNCMKLNAALWTRLCIIS